MTTIYLESSAVLAWLNGEPRSGLIRSLIDRAELVLTSVLTAVEVRRGIVRREWKGEISAGDGNKLTGLLEGRLAVWEIVGFSEEIQRRASQRFPVEPVRSLDAIHLATAIEMVKIYQDIQVVALDKRIQQNLAPLGLPLASLELKHD